MVDLFDAFFYKLWPAVHIFTATFFVLVIVNQSFKIVFFNPIT